MSKKSKTLGAPVSSPAGVQRAGEDTGVPRKNTPRLRFPEFRDAGEWEACNLNQVFLEMSNGLSLEQSNDLTGYKVTRIETISGDVIDINKVGYVKKGLDISRYRLNVGDILFSNINSISHIGRSVIVDQDYDLYHGMNLLRLVVESSSNDSRFLYYLLNTEDIRSSIKSRANKAVNQASINQTELGRTLLIVPKQKEQQKIADCLSSLDALIAAQSEKLDALKTHKKGLMQRLFPRVGETVPRLRFPEFRDAGAWEEKTLGDKDVSEFVKKRVPLNELTIDSYVSTENILPDFGGIASASKLPSSGSFTSYKKSDILIANIRPYLKKISVADRSGGASNDVIVVRSREKVENLFLSSLLKNDVFINYVMKGAKGVKMPRGDISLMKEYPIAIPGPEEQQKIADCLSSLDALIAAQSEKLDALKTHKKGLMQQLFPAVEAVGV